MDIANFDALKAQGRILDAANVDPEQDYFLLGKYTNKYTTDNFKYTKYPVWAIKAGDVMGVQSVTGLNTDNTDPFNPIVKISVDSVTIIGEGTPASPLSVQTKYKVYSALVSQSSTADPTITVLENTIPGFTLNLVREDVGYYVSDIDYDFDFDKVFITTGNSSIWINPASQNPPKMPKIIGAVYDNDYFFKITTFGFTGNAGSFIKEYQDSSLSRTSIEIRVYN